MIDDKIKRELSLPSPLQEINSPFLTSKVIKLYVKRDDLIHPTITGNKWRKLKYNINSILTKNIKTVVSFGGAYSNHIYALAAAGQLFNFNTVGVIRGEPCEPLNPTLACAKQVGMSLHYVSRKEYRNKTSREFLEKLKSQYGEFYLLPEGGSNQLALPGCAEIVDELDSQLNGDYNYICLPCGTGGTLAGLISSNTPKYLLGFSVLKGGSFLNNDIKNLLGDAVNDNWEINLDYHFGGYAKRKSELVTFIADFFNIYGIRLEPVYSGKMFYGLFELISRDFFAKGSTIVALHTGGLQNENFQ